MIFFHKSLLKLRYTLSLIKIICCRKTRRATMHLSCHQTAGHDRDMKEAKNSEMLVKFRYLETTVQIITVFMKKIDNRLNCDDTASLFVSFKY
jgi:hypothetical protein